MKETKRLRWGPRSPSSPRAKAGALVLGLTFLALLVSFHLWRERELSRSAADSLPMERAQSEELSLGN